MEGAHEQALDPVTKDRKKARFHAMRTPLGMTAKGTFFTGREAKIPLNIFVTAFHAW
jgi:hypothetical protein